MSKQLSLLPVVLLLFHLLAYSQQRPEVSALADRTKILIGEQIQLELSAKFPRNMLPSFFQLDSLAHFEILERSKIDTQLSDNEVRLSQRILLTSWDSGRWQLPSFQLAGKPLKTKPIIIDVGHTPFDVKKDYNDVKDILETTKPKSPKWHWYLIGAILLLVLFLLLFPRKKKAPAESTLDPNAYKKAISELQQLDKSGSAATDPKAFYTSLIQIFRTYLHQRKGIQSYSKTTEDLAAQLKNMNLPASLHPKLLETLQLSDAVKFARLQPDEKENKESLDVIKTSIDTIENQ